MTPIEGKIAIGLDEFMLRLGHVKLFCRVARESQGSRMAVDREMGSILNRKVKVPKDYHAHVARYLREKRLCRVTGNKGNNSLGSPSNDVRYPDIWLATSGNILFYDESNVNEPAIQQQDLWLADPLVRSRVGAIPLARGKGSSKTGLSHIADWCAILDAATSSGDLTAEGHLIGSISDASNPLSNPYVIGMEKLVFAFLVCTSDFDVFSRMATILIDTSNLIETIDRKTAIEIFRESVRSLATHAESDPRLSASVFRTITHLVKEVGGDAIFDERWRASTASTAWHRASSRYEAYVDLGLLDKGLHDEAERFQYTYHVSELLRTASLSLRDTMSADHWIAAHLVSLFGSGTPSTAPVRPEELLPFVSTLARIMRRPTSLLPITALALGFAMLIAESGRLVSLATVRQAIEDLATQFPERARLSRGSTGERAEFVSIETRGIGNGTYASALFC